MRYTVVEQSTLTGCISSVDELMSLGWIPQGGIQVVHWGLLSGND